jgi:hypothetical protein
MNQTTPTGTEAGDLNKHESVLRELLMCFASWEPQVRVLGNVRADDAFNAINDALARRAAPATTASASIADRAEQAAILGSENQCRDALLEIAEHSRAAQPVQAGEAVELPPLPDGDEYSATRMLANGELAPRFTAATLREFGHACYAMGRASLAPVSAQQGAAEQHNAVECDSALRAEPASQHVSFGSEADLIDWLDKLHCAEATGAVTNQKWPPAQYAIAALKQYALPVEPKKAVSGMNRAELQVEVFELRAQLATLMDPGFTLVPTEPTETMVHAAEDVPAPRPFGKVYRAMIAAAPKADSLIDSRCRAEGGDTSDSSVCRGCNGSGWVVRDPDIGTDQECFVCDGTGNIADLSDLAAKAPAAQADDLRLAICNIPLPVYGSNSFQHGFVSAKEAVLDLLSKRAASPASTPEAAPEQQLATDKRALVLLKAAHDLLKKQRESSYVLNLLAETVFYDDADCDGGCLMEDIGYVLDDAAMRATQQEGE